MLKGLVWARPAARLLRVLSPLWCSTAVWVLGEFICRLTEVKSVRIMLPAGNLVFQDYAISATSAAFVAKDYQARVTWGIAELLVVLTSLVAIGLGARIIFSALRRESLALKTIFGALILAESWVGKQVSPPFPKEAFTFRAHDPNATLYPVIDSLVQHTLAKPGYLSSADPGITIPRMMDLVGWPPTVAMVLIGLGFCAVLLRPLQSRSPALEEDLRLAGQQVKWLLYAGAGLLVSGVSAVTAFYLWPVVFVPPEAPAAVTSAETIKSVAAVVALATGSIDSLLLLGVFLPAAYHLHKCAERLVSSQEVAPGDREKWLEEKRLALSPAQQLKPILAVLSPLLAGGSASALINIFVGGG